MGVRRSRRSKVDENPVAFLAMIALWTIAGGFIIMAIVLWIKGDISTDNINLCRVLMEK
jgi:hypothetical protein